MPLSFPAGSGLRFTRAETLPALGALVYSLARVLSGPTSGLLAHRLGVAAAMATVLSLLMVFRLRYPVPTGVVAVAGDWLVYAPGVMLLALFTVAQQGRVRSAWALGSVAAVAGACTPWLTGATPYTLTFWGYYLARTLSYVAIPVLVGDFFRAGHVRILTLSEYTDQLVREQQLLAERAQVQERTRIAQEMHDVVAHRLTHVVIHAGALKMHPDRGPQWVADKAELIRRSGVQALDELRVVLGLLQEPGGTGSPSPLGPPGVHALERLAEGTRATGTEVTLSLAEPPGPVPGAVQAVVYRLVQEGLTNAVRYAPGAPVRVELRYGPGVLDIGVTNGPATGTTSPLPSGGHGLAGLRSRVESLGGEFSARPLPDGGFRLGARVPLIIEPGPAGPSRENNDQSNAG
ncbi:sensor histidine kinase [Streptomyces gamaensis]|uniref:histidine kinase n=1 Tax=Streptomyces gamaensis TaxID=1763542 RepID=A0ABW0YWB2_9ACTN